MFWIFIGCTGRVVVLAGSLVAVVMVGVVAGAKQIRFYLASALPIAHERCRAPHVALNANWTFVH
jgi:hypothetical protein